MHPDIAKAALVFMARAQMQGNEAPTFMQVVAALEALANPAPLPAPEPTAEPAAA